MNASLKTILTILVAIAALAIIVLILPEAAGAWLLNSATANLARAASLPNDSPDRMLSLNQADVVLRQAQTISQNPRLALARARLAIEAHDSSHTVSTLANSNAALSSDAIAQFDWANAAWESNQPGVAFEHWRAAGALVYFSQQMQRAAFAHQWNDTEKFARIAIGIDPTNADAHYFLGDALSRQSIDDVQALNELDRAATLTRNPEFLSTILSRKGEILAEQGRLAEALAVFQQARAVAPIDGRPRTGYALVSIKLDPTRYVESVDLLEHVVGDSPWYSAAYIALADLSESRGNARAAEEWLKTGLQKNPNNPNLLFALGKFYARLRRVDDARATLILALKNETHWDDLQSISRTLAELPPQ